MNLDENNHVVLRDYFMKKEKKMSEWTNEEIILFHTIIHQSFSNKKDSNLSDVHQLVVSELITRDIGHSMYDDLDEVDTNE